MILIHQYQQDYQHDHHKQLDQINHIYIPIEYLHQLK